MNLLLKRCSFQATDSEYTAYEDGNWLFSAEIERTMLIGEFGIAPDEIQIEITLPVPAPAAGEERGEE